MILSLSRPTARLRQPEDNVGTQHLEHEELRALVSSALHHELGLSPSGKLSTSKTPTADTLTLHRVDGLALKHSPALGLPTGVHAEVSSRALGQSLAGLSLGRTTQIVSHLFRDFRVDFLVFKGVTLSALTARDIGERGAGDIDVLVNSSDVPRVHRELLKRGFTPEISFTPKEGRMWRFWSFRERELSYRRDDIFVDLHWRISKDPNQLPPTHRVLARATSVPVGSDQIDTLTPGDALAAAAQHLYLDYCQNIRLIVDVVYLTHVPGVSLPTDLPKSGRQLVSDVLEFSRLLLGEALIAQVPGALPPQPRNVKYLASLWNQNSSASLLAAGPTSGGNEAFGRLGHWLKYSPRPSTLARFVAWAICAFPPYTESTPHTGLTKAVVYRVRQIATGQLPYLKERQAIRLRDDA